MPAAPTLFLAPTASEARFAAWQWVCEKRPVSPASLQELLDPPLVFTDASGARAWRDLARFGVSQTAFMPRLGRADAFFARSTASLSRTRALSGADRLWVLQSASRRAFSAQIHSETDVSETDAARLQKPEFLAHFAHQIAALRRAHFSRFPDVEAAEELNALLRAYDARLADLEAFDFEAAPALFPAAAAKNQAFAWPRTLIVDALLDPSPALQIGLDALLSRAGCVAATLVCPGGIDNDAALENALDFWKTRGAQIIRAGDFAAPRARIAANILGSETQIEARIETPVAVPPGLFLTPAHTPQEEMEAIAAHIRSEIEDGARADDFCLALADLGAYEADARGAFERYGVPLNWPRPRRLNSSPLVRALLRAARSCQTRLNVHELHDLFADGTLRLQSEERVFDARRLRAAALAAHHPELSDLSATRAAFERKRAQFTQNPRHDKEAARARIETSILAGDLEIVSEFESLRAPFCVSCSALAWQNQISELTRRLAGHWNEIEVANQAATRAQEDLARFQAAVESVVQRARAWEDEAHKRGAGEWLSWLEMEIASGAADDFSPENGEVGGVRVTGLGHFDFGARATFFCGLSERAWPILPSSDALSRELGPILSGYQASPPIRATHLLARAIGETPALFLSHAGFQNGKEVPASPLLDDLKAAFPQANWPRLAPTSHLASRRDHLVACHQFVVDGGTLPAKFDVFAGENHGESVAHLETLWKMRAQRRETEIGVYDGALGPRAGELIAELDAKNGGARLSGSELEFYARCPIRYFFERVLRLKTEEREGGAGGDIDAREAGTLVHEIVRGFLLAWKTPLGREDFETALETLGQIAQNECEKLPLRPILREAEWHRLMGADGRSGPLVKWLQLEIGLGNGAWGREMRPFVHRNLPFDGVSSGLEHRFEIEIGGHKVRGFIDRLDISAGGEQIAVIDYKTGAVAGLPSWRSGDSGLHFQLAIYALAVRQLCESLGEKPRLSMAYLSLREAKIARGIGQEGTLGKGCSGGKMLGDAQFEAWLDETRARAVRVAELRGGGVFNISLQSAKDAKCEGCSSKMLCGRNDETQAARLETHRDSPFFYAPSVRDWDA